ncbi:MAG: histidine phosphatase family protein [Thermodesulfobacteriota bacterium]
MKILRMIGLLVGLMAAAASATAQQKDLLSGKALVEALRRGGYNIYFRHAATDWSKNDRVEAPGDWTHCSPRRMRQLSEEGRATARQIGEAIRRLGIPIGPVFSSQYCRARQTAEQMALGPVKATIEIMNLRTADFAGGRNAVTERARQKLSIPPPKGTNALFVAHGNLMRAVSGAYTDEAGAVVFDPVGDGEFDLVAELTPTDWQRLADAFAEDQ